MARLTIFSTILITLLHITTSLAFPTNTSPPTIMARQTETGKATVYLQNGGTGSCGIVNPDSALIVALSNTYMHGVANAPDCGRKIQITNTGSDDGVGGAGKVVVATVADTCPSCESQDIDLSVGAWDAATGGAPYGTFEASWAFIS